MDQPDIQRLEPMTPPMYLPPIVRNFRRSETIGALAAALAKAQGAIQNAAKDSANPYYHSKYADLAAIMDACRGPLAENEISVMQFPRAADDECVEVETFLAHSSGEWVSETLKLPATMQGKDGKERFDSQSVGSAITYCRRYALASIVGVAAEDDDGNAAAKRAAEQAAATREKAMKILRAAVKDGLPALELAWKSLSLDMRKVCQADLPTLKKDAEANAPAAS